MTVNTYFSSGIMRRFLFLTALYAGILLTACSCEKTESSKDADSIAEQDISQPDADFCPVAPAGPCEMEATTRCMNNEVYQCVHVKNQQGCVIEHTLKLVKTCGDAAAPYCVVTQEPQPGIAGTAVCGESDCPAPDKALWPYYTREGKMHFCRSCDMTNTELLKKDPACISNLWRFENEKNCKTYPQYDCCGNPCDMPNLKPRYDTSFNISQCDAFPTPLTQTETWTAGSDKRRWFNISEGKIGFIMSSGYTPYILGYLYRAFEYDLEKKTYKIIGPAGTDALAYFKGNFFTSVRDYNRIKNLETDFNTETPDYLVYYAKNGTITLAYDKPITPPSYPTIGERWAAANFIPKDKSNTLPYRYARIGEWKWQPLHNSLSWGTVREDTLIYGTWEQDVYWCDLTKAPKSSQDCIKVNRGEEKGVYAIMDAASGKRGAFTEHNSNTIYVVTLQDNGTLSYEAIVPQKTEQNHVAFTTSHLSGDLLLYGESFNNGALDSKMCFYNLKTKQQYCSKPVNIYNGLTSYNQADTEFEGKWMVWQRFGSGIQMRDLACYCKEYPESCPYPEMRPRKQRNIKKSMR